MGGAIDLLSQQFKETAVASCLQMRCQGHGTSQLYHHSVSVSMQFTQPRACSMECSINQVKGGLSCHADLA